MEPSKAFGKVLRERRSASGLSQEKLALEAGLERVYISLLERGQRQPTLTTLLKLAGPLACDASDLVREAEILCREE
ncbi:MAG: helix-turn-helix transcriptional regulator [Rhodocyclaceae bacterium]|nr:helix-turn-helix transcriptional regulator [Rhodocyclaceae bacterium]